MSAIGVTALTQPTQALEEVGASYDVACEYTAEGKFKVRTCKKPGYHSFCRTAQGIPPPSRLWVQDSMVDRFVRTTPTKWGPLCRL